MKNHTLLGGMFLGLLVLVVVVCAVRISSQRVRSSPAGKKPAVVASIYPLADFAKRIGGDLIEVTLVTPAGGEPHDYEPTPQDIIRIENAKLFLFNGNGVDGWADKLKDDARATGVMVVRMADHIESLRGDSRDMETGGDDPHFWLDPVNAATEVREITEALARIDPVHAADYAERRDAYQRELYELDQQYATGLAECGSHTIVTSHDAFRYLAHRYHLDTRYILGASPDEEPSPQKIAGIADMAKKEHLGYIFFETLVSPQLAETIAREVGAKTLALNPIEGLTKEEIRDGKDYLSLMRDNLTALRTALICRP